MEIRPVSNTLPAQEKIEPAKKLESKPVDKETTPQAAALAPDAEGLAKPQQANKQFETKRTLGVA